MFWLLTISLLHGFQKYIVNLKWQVCFLINEKPNKGSSVYYISAGLAMGLHYQQKISEGLHHPISVVCGEHRLGKTKTARAALQLMGNGHHFFSSVWDRFLPHLCSRSSFPPMLYDLKRPISWGDCPRPLRLREIVPVRKKWCRWAAQWSQLIGKH